MARFSDSVIVFFYSFLANCTPKIQFAYPQLIVLFEHTLFVLLGYICIWSSLGNACMTTSKKRSAPKGNIEGTQRYMPRARGGSNKWNTGGRGNAILRRRKPYSRPSGGTKTWNRRPKARPTVLAPAVQRRQVSTALTTWASLPGTPQNPGAHLNPFYCQVPNGS